MTDESPYNTYYMLPFDDQERYVDFISSNHHLMMMLLSDAIEDGDAYIKQTLYSDIFNLSYGQKCFDLFFNYLPYMDVDAINYHLIIDGIRLCKEEDKSFFFKKIYIYLKPEILRKYVEFQIL